MNTTTQVKAFCGRATILAALAVLCLVSTAPHCYAQTQTRTGEVPSAVANQLTELKAEIGQLESKVTYLASLIPSSVALRPNLPEPRQVTLTGRVSCGHCEGIQPVRKGFTPFSWALYSISQGDDIVLVASDKTYKLQGDKNKLLRLMSDKAQVTGRLQSNSLQVEALDRAQKQK